jgi:phage terminase large subunit-like protein
VTTALVSHAHVGRAGRLVPDTLPHFEAWSARLIVDGRRFTADPFQSTALEDFFDGVVETMLLLPKGNGKTTLLAILALYHLCYTDEAEAYIAAASKDQATQMYRYCVRIVRANPGLKKQLKVQEGYRRILHRTRGGELRVIPADANTVDGTAATLALVDELHRHKDGGALYQTLRDGLIKRGGRLISITTAGWDHLSVLGRTRAAALSHVVERRPGYVYCRTPDGQFVMHEWALNLEEFDPHDMRHVKLCNPLQHLTIEDLQKLHDSPSMTQLDWLRYRCNVWVQDRTAALPEAEWNACVLEGVEITDAAPRVVIGGDLGWLLDTTAFVAVAEDPTYMTERPADLDDDAPFTPRPRIVVDRPRILTPPGDGAYLPFSIALGAVGAMVEKYGAHRTTFVFDPSSSGHQLAEALEKTYGIEVVRQKQTNVEMADAYAKTVEVVRDRVLAHGAYPELDEHVLYATAKSVGGTDLTRFDKGPGGQPNDAAIAMAIAIRQFTEPTEPVFQPFAFFV